MPRTPPPKPRAGNTWTESRYWGFIRSALRRAWTRYPVRFQVLAKAKRTKPARNAGRHRYEYKCAQCKKWYQQKEVNVDHIEECGSLKCKEDLPKFVSTLFCEEDNLRVLCKPCHKKVTQAAKEERKK